MKKVNVVLSVLFALLLVCEGMAYAGAACSAGMNESKTAGSGKKTVCKNNFVPGHRKTAPVPAPAPAKAS